MNIWEEETQMIEMVLSLSQFCIFFELNNVLALSSIDNKHLFDVGYVC